MSPISDEGAKKVNQQAVANAPTPQMVTNTVPLATKCASFQQPDFSISRHGYTDSNYDLFVDSVYSDIDSDM